MGRRLLEAIEVPFVWIAIIGFAVLLGLRIIRDSESDAENWG